jgi:recombination protein RecR
LGGVINAIEGSGPDELNIKPLLEKIKNNKIEEVVLALDPNFEGETTVMYLTKLIKPYKIKISRLAKGLPMGADLEYADEMTLANALKYRNEL